MCHCVKNARYFVKLFVVAPLLTLLTIGVIGLLAFLVPSISTSIFGVLLAFMYVCMFYIAKLTIHAIRFVTLDEKPEHIANIKYFKQTFLNGSYLFLIMIYALLAYFILILVSSYFFPIDNSYAQPIFGQQAEISSAVVNQLNQLGFHAQPQSSSYMMYFEYILFFVTFGVIFGALEFNVIAVSSDIEIPFYRSMFRLKGFFMVNFLIAICTILLQMFSIYLENLIIYSISNMALMAILVVLVIVLSYFISIFFQLCFARNFKLWYQANK